MVGRGREGGAAGPGPGVLPAAWELCTSSVLPCGVEMLPKLSFAPLVLSGKSLLPACNDKASVSPASALQCAEAHEKKDPQMIV